MSFFFKPIHAVFSILILLQLFTFASAIKLDAKSCAPYKTRLDKALKEVEDIVTYAEKRADPKSQHQRLGNLLQDMLDASSEDDVYVLRQVQTYLNAAKKTLAKTDIIIHCDDKHLTNGGKKDLFFDNSNDRQARVQVLDSPKRKGGACGSVMRAFAYDFYDKKTHKKDGKVIVLCSDSSTGALKAADNTGNDITFYRRMTLDKMSQGIDFFGRFLSYMILHELMHATDGTQFPVNPGLKAELYGYNEITGHAVGVKKDGGPSSLVRLHNADSYALLACGWYMNAYYFEDGKFVIAPKRLPKALKRNPVKLLEREPKSKPKTSKKGDDLPATSATPALSTQAPLPASTRASPSSQVTTQPGTTPSAASTSSGSRTVSSSSSSWLPPIQTAIGDKASEFLPIAAIAIPIVALPDWDFGNDTLNDTDSSLPGTGSPGSMTSVLSDIGTGVPMPITSLPIGTGIPSTGFFTSIVTKSCNGTL